MFSFFRRRSKKAKYVESIRSRLQDSAFESVRKRPYKIILPLIAFVGFSFILALLCFWGQSSAGPQVLPGQIAKFRIIADIPFTYKSKILKDRLKEQRRRMTTPVFKLSMAPYNAFRDKIHIVNERLNAIGKQPISIQEKGIEVQLLTDQLNLELGLNIRTEDLYILLIQTNEETRNHIIEEGLIFLNEVHHAGILDFKHAQIHLDPNRPHSFAIDILNHPNDTQVHSKEDALLAFRRYLRVLELSSDLNKALYRLLQLGIVPNLEYNEEATNNKIEQALEQIQPVYVTVRAGEVIIEPGTTISEEQHEQLSAYRKALIAESRNQYGLDAYFFEGWALTAGVLLVALLYSYASLPYLFRRTKHFFSLASIITTNLLIIRVIIQISNTDLFLSHPTLIYLLPYLMPVVLGPIVITVVADVRMAILCSFLISFFDSLMLGNNVETLLVALMASLVSIHLCKNIRRRGKIVRTALIAGTLTGLYAVFIGYFDHFSWYIIFLQFTTALVTALLTSILAIVLIPVFERIFNYTSNITLLELADFNHAILRKLQMIAPGTYHHSLMVANLSERAAMEIGANGLLCRTCALFHDIGKMIKPEYFTENQRDILNPHTEKNPSMSALIIKSHISEGVEIARQAQLPSIIADIIRQHHGTTLIQYFYSKALDVAKVSGELNENKSIDDSTFRYDGPKPQTKEAAIIMIADSIEAASRSIKKVTPQSINDLIEYIVNERMQSHQFDDCPITLAEIAIIKKSFAFSTLNMLHSRVEYPKDATKENKESSSKK